MARYKVVVALVAISLLAALPASAQWKWRDKAGRTQYSDTPPPPDVGESAILQRPVGSNGLKQRVVQPGPATASTASTTAPAASSAASAPTLTPKMVEPELEAKRKKAEQDAAKELAEKKKAEEARVNAIKAENCKQATSYMRSIDGGMRIARTNEKGEREILDDAARAAEAKKTRDVMASECK
jgi:hypothetical protein